jgi:cysteine desulfurase
MKGINKRVFLDYASTTPIDKDILKKISKILKRDFYNASAFYSEAMKVSSILVSSREKVATLAGAKPDEVIFTGSGTEADNLALFGVLKAIKKNKSGFFDFWDNKTPHIITTKIEHPAILEACVELEKTGTAEITYLPVLENGRIDTSKLQKYFKPETILVSIILANNEIGVIQSVRNINSEIKKYKKSINRSFNEPPFLHTDASQAPSFLNINIDTLGAQLMTLDSSKFYGPKGVGCLIRKNHVPLDRILFGGGQEGGFRPGTENVPMIHGFAEALEKAQVNREKNSEKISKLQSYFIEQIEKELISVVPEIKINGSIKNRLPNNINICVPGLNSEFAVIQLDEIGVACSAMTACKTSSETAQSHVIDALGYNCGTSSLRFTMGKKTNKGDIDFTIKALKKII